MRNRKGERGVALLMVVLVVTLLTAVIVDFSFRTRLDSQIAANVRDTALASTLARSGYEIALSLLMDDAEAGATEETSSENTGETAVSRLVQQARDKARLSKSGEGGNGAGGAGGIDTLQEAWARMDLLELPLPPNESLRVDVDDLAGRINLNAVIIRDQAGVEKLNQPVFDQLTSLFQQALESLGRDNLGQAEGLDGEEIAYAVADWVDSDETRLSDGSFEDQYYNSLKDAYSSKNGPFDSVAELQLVEGIDDKLYAAVKDAVTVYPFEGAGGININTAPVSVLRSIGMRENEAIAAPEPLSDENVQRILDARNEGVGIGSLTDLKDILGVDPATVFSPPIVFASNYFEVRAVAKVNESSAHLEAVIERAQEGPRVLYWRVD